MNEDLTRCPANAAEAYVVGDLGPATNAGAAGSIGAPATPETLIANANHYKLYYTKMS